MQQNAIIYDTASRPLLSTPERADASRISKARCASLCFVALPGDPSEYIPFHACEVSGALSTVVDLVNDMSFTLSTVVDLVNDMSFTLSTVVDLVNDMSFTLSTVVDLINDMSSTLSTVVDLINDMSFTLSTVVDLINDMSFTLSTVVDNQSKCIINNSKFIYA
jgi:predicted nucleotidyltransferase